MRADMRALGAMLALLATVSTASWPASAHAAEPIDLVPTPAAGGPARLHVHRQPIDALPMAVPASLPVSQPSTATIAAEPAAELQRALDAARGVAQAYGVTFAAARQGELLWAGASGVERDGQTALSADDSLVVGSLAKTFVAALVLRLAEEGHLALDDRVARHLPEVGSLVPDATIWQLLGHTSGLADVYNEKTKAVIEATPARAMFHAEVLATISDPWFAPGQSWAYSNTNYLLLAMIVERKLGEPLGTALDTQLLDRLHLDATRVLNGAEADAPLPAAWASVFFGSGAMASSAVDMARWGDALYVGDVVTPASRELMLRFNEHDHGLGVQRFELGSHKAFGHTGLLTTHSSLLVHVPEADLTLALLVNRTDVDLVAVLLGAPEGGRSLLDLALGAVDPALVGAAH